MGRHRLFNIAISTAFILIFYVSEVTGRSAPQKTYTVKPGDSVAKIADFYGVAQDDLRLENDLGKRKALKIGQEIRIPTYFKGGGKGHIVKKGDTLARIAKKYKVPIKKLKAVNKIGKKGHLQLGRTIVIPLKNPVKRKYIPKKQLKLVKSGKLIPGGVLHTVQSGQTLWMIARAYNISKEKIAHRNHISIKKTLNVGQKIKIPGAKEVVPVRIKGYKVAPIHFLRVYNNKNLTIRLVNKHGKIIPRSRKRLSKLAASKPKGRHKRSRFKMLHPRLIHMLQRVSERYPGSTFEIVSGYRPHQKGHESRHAMGRAMDFRIPGVPNRELYQFCTKLPNSGCGYYPNSVFIHMDARERPTVWTDYSRPGEKANYKKPAKNNSASQTEDNKTAPVITRPASVDTQQTTPGSPPPVNAADGRQYPE